MIDAETLYIYRYAYHPGAPGTVVAVVVW